MKSIYLKEQDGFEYSEKDLIELLIQAGVENKDNKPSNIIGKLRKEHIIKGRRNSKNSVKQDESPDVQDEDDDLYDDVINDTQKSNNGVDFSLNFVGIIVVEGYALICYPKYLPDICEGNKGSIVGKMRQALKVFDKYNKSGPYHISMFDDISDSSHDGSLLDLYKFFLDDYYENGLYGNTIDVIESNGSGEILWDKTVNEVMPILSNGSPIYPEVYTKKRIDDEYDYFRRLHKYVLTQASADLEEAHLLDLFDLTGAYLSEESVSDLGDEEYVRYRLNRELNVQFNTRKQRLLNAMLAYFEKDDRLTYVECFSLFGTSSFNMVWEEALRTVFDRNKETKDKRNSIKGPIWGKAGEAKGNLKPDIVYVKGSKFVILDAKYYVPKFNPGKPPVNQPDVDDIAKQYFYQLAFQKGIENGNFSVVNCLLFPTDNKEVRGEYDVHFDFLEGLKLGSEPGYKFEPIKVRFLPASTVFECYLNDDPYPDEEYVLGEMNAEEVLPAIAGGQV